MLLAEPFLTQTLFITCGSKLLALHGGILAAFNAHQNLVVIIGGFALS